MQMTDFKAKMHQIRFRLGLRPRPRWGSLQRSPRSSSWIWGPLRGRGGARLGKTRERGGEAEGGEVEGREREGPKLLLNQGPSEPCYAIGTNKTFAGNHGRLVYSILYRVQLKCVTTKPAISHKRLIWRTGNMTDQTVSDPTRTNLIKVTVTYRIPYRIFTSNLHQTVYVGNYHTWAALRATAMLVWIWVKPITRTQSPCWAAT